LDKRDLFKQRTVALEALTINLPPDRRLFRQHLHLKARSGRKDFLPVEPQGGHSFLFRLSEPSRLISRYAGDVVGQTLAMEGMFAFFMESAFVGALVWGEKRLGPRVHFLTALLVATGREFAYGPDSEIASGGKELVE
jgi:hypothetical protein